jgi:hypothetical protein
MEHVDSSLDREDDPVTFLRLPYSKLRIFSEKYSSSGAREHRFGLSASELMASSSRLYQRPALIGARAANDT